METVCATVRTSTVCSDYVIGFFCTILSLHKSKQTLEVLMRKFTKRATSPSLQAAFNFMAVEISRRARLYRLVNHPSYPLHTHTFLPDTKHSMNTEVLGGKGTAK